MSALRRVIQTRHRNDHPSLEPWQLNIPLDAEGGVGANAPGGRLFHYLAGGGLRAFGGSLDRFRIERRQNRFLIGVVALAVLWVLGRYL